MSYNMKNLQTRVAECVSIRTQLLAQGVLSIPEVAEKLSQHMNIYVRTGESQTFDLKTHEKGIVYRVILTSRDGKQSGVEMIR